MSTSQPASLVELLGSDDPTTQARQVTELLQRVQLPPITLIVTFDPFTGGATVADPTGKLSLDGAQLALAAATQYLAQQRIAASQQAQAAAAPPVKRGRRR